ncbi:hypothetical protein M441DRAFT_235076 [Trichoderma asperellum CBS 433.97]|uniref:Uncharacterized protein n=1 Tax=Trichoderma asperellum (strain ATCC 204424 / CBS 433.97 / NBRC 101777) TaxID=1042311 RepID=A0A2T3Z192_TRIA4|nr:hypothetical protein M441DRAFT_235076 [Trichoderma asperellum CBS 433.97]PTB38530.1 hypothetical protein M441DRAFT_235076 [Trichoderma asperellum CBS 433.97]
MAELDAQWSGCQTHGDASADGVKAARRRNWASCLALAADKIIEKKKNLLQRSRLDRLLRPSSVLQVAYNALLLLLSPHSCVLFYGRGCVESAACTIPRSKPVKGCAVPAVFGSLHSLRCAWQLWTRYSSIRKSPHVRSQRGKLYANHSPVLF